MTLDVQNLLNTPPRILNGTCTLTLENGLPGGWNATIVEAGAKFFYLDGTSFVDGPRKVSVPTGSRATFRSNKPDGCVSTIFVTCLVSVAGGTPQRVDYTEPSEPGNCWITVDVRLGPKAAVAHADLLADNWLGAIELGKA